MTWTKELSTYAEKFHEQQRTTVLLAEDRYAT